MKQDSKEYSLNEYTEVYNSIVESGQNPHNVLVSFLLRSNFPCERFDRENVFVDVNYDGNKRGCLRFLNSLECIIEDARERLNVRCSGFIKNKLTGRFYGSIKMADGSSKYMDFVISNIADMRNRVVCKCLVLVLSDSKDSEYGHEIEYTVIDDVSNEKIHATVEF